MKSKRKITLILSVLFFCLFVLWTLALRFVDVGPIGPQDTSVGFATLNSAFWDFLGSRMYLYTITDWLGLVPIAVCISFAAWGAVLLFKRKSLFLVDRDMLFLGIVYISVIAVYIFFEKYVVNYRPILINGVLEASYPSSTALLTLTVMPTANIKLNQHIKNTKPKAVLTAVFTLFTAFMLAARVLSGVHWITDIIGGCLFALSVVLLYGYAVKK